METTEQRINEIKVAIKTLKGIKATWINNVLNQGLYIGFRNDNTDVYACTSGSAKISVGGAMVANKTQAIEYLKLEIENYNN